MYQKQYLQFSNSGYSGKWSLWSCWPFGLSELFAPIHSLYVLKVVIFQFFPLQLERVCDQTRLRGPWVGAQMHLQWNLKPLEFD